VQRLHGVRQDNDRVLHSGLHGGSPLDCSRWMFDVAAPGRLA
jgi:hypothetical protein